MKYWVYRQYDKNGRLLYIGCTSMPDIRMTLHRNKPSHCHWFSKIETVKFTGFDSKAKAYAAESTAISREKPRHNVFKRVDYAKKRKEFKALRAKGITMREIGEREKPKVSRQYVWQILHNQNLRYG